MNNRSRGSMILFVAALTVWNTILTGAAVEVLINVHERGETLLLPGDGSDPDWNVIPLAFGSYTVLWKSTRWHHRWNERPPSTELSFWPPPSTVESGKQLVSLRSSSFL